MPIHCEPNQLFRVNKNRLINYLVLILNLGHVSSTGRGYGQMSNDTTAHAFFGNQRTRLTFGYQVLDKLNFQFSIQDIRIYGKDDPRTGAGTIQVFEAYAEPYLTKNLSIRLGRQRLMYDNQRLFAQNDWRQNANTHDGINIRYINTKLQTELAGAWNQTAESCWH
jgi:hypothetical protein